MIFLDLLSFLFKPLVNFKTLKYDKIIAERGPKKQTVIMKYMKCTSEGQKTKQYDFPGMKRYSAQPRSGGEAKDVATTQTAAA